MKILFPCYALVSTKTGKIMMTGGGMPITSHNKFVIEESLKRLGEDYRVEVRELPPTILTTLMGEE